MSFQDVVDIDGVMWQVVAVAEFRMSHWVAHVRVFGEEGESQWFCCSDSSIVPELCVPMGAHTGIILQK